ncbi:TonB-dependent receptor [Colwellia sp. E2M01]|uniref:TonB-dependent receptor n=1 Tax=Colwellia sp. E2M01 TaxID=2841561 RepID=UPI001C0A0662|nr:TonB-dependent receptor [Colwellia sp. E2M01]MBU2870432.1 TonB-dependent receptor [Colwellia sp. E2M01]
MTSNNKVFKKNIITASILAGVFLSSSPLYAAEAEANIASEVNKAEAEPEVIIVRGLRGSLVKSMNDKRYSSSVVDTINATDIGKLPDATIADSLQRITGIQITRSAGEGGKVNIRGVSQVATTLNGEQMLAAGSISTVQPDFSDIPSTLVSGLEVIKSSQAKYLSGGLSGTINLKTNRPLMLDEGWTALGKVEAAKGSLGTETDGKLSAFIGYNLNSETGISLSMSHDDSTLADYQNGSAGNEWGFNASESINFVQDDVDANGNGRLDDVYYAFQGHQASNQFIERERDGLNLSIQHEISESFSVTADVFYTELTEHRYQAGFVASQAWQAETGWFTATDYVAHENIIENKDKDSANFGQFENVGGAYNSYQNGTIQARRTMVHSETSSKDQTALNTNLEFTYDAGEALALTARWVHGEASNEQQNSFVDAYVNDGSQVGATYKGPGGVVESDVNPWGYAGQSAMLPDGTPAGNYTQIPIGVGYVGTTQLWNLPTLDVTETDGSVTTEKFGSNIERYSNTSSNLDGENQNATFDALRIDGSYELDLDGFASDLMSVDFGARYAKRNVDRTTWRGTAAYTNAYGDPYLAHWKDSASQAPGTLESYIDPIAFTDPIMEGKITQISDFHGSEGLGSLYFVDPKAMSNPLAYHEEVYGTIIQSPEPSGTYEAEEVTTDLYLQGNFDGEVFGLGYRANLGVRYVKTEYDIDQTETGSGDTATYNGVEYIVSGALGTPAPAAGIINTTRSYEDWLPSLNMTLDLTEDQVLRFAYNKTMSPQDINNLARGVTVTRTLGCGVKAPDGSAVFCATAASQDGNPNLDPWRSNNFDLSYEWYFSESSMVSAGIFYMDIESFTSRQTIELPIPDSDGVVRGFNDGIYSGTTPTTTEANSDGGSINGIELTYQQGFDFLPGIWSGFGLTTNYTYSPSESGDTDYYGESTPMSDNSEHLANVALWYEKDGLQARIASNYRSDKYMSLATKAPYKFARYQAPTLYVDASVSYDINDMFTVILQGTNLTEEHQEEYLQWDDLVDKRNFNERRYSIGVQIKM